MFDSAALVLEEISPTTRLAPKFLAKCRKVVDVAIKGHVIAEATLTGRYAKKGSKR
jgi:hypothetical protein